MQTMTEEINHCPVCNGTRFERFLDVTDHFLSGEMFRILACGDCGFRFVSPRPVASDIGRYYESDRYISHDASSMNLFNLAYRFARRWSVGMKYSVVAKHAGPGDILDIGCGTGEFLHHCARKGHKVAGVEINTKARDFATGRYGITTTADLTSMAGTGRIFRCITLWHVLEHLHELNTSLETIRTLMAPGGTLVVAVPNSNSSDAEHYREFWAAYDVPRHLYHFTADTLTRLMKNHGLALRATLPQKLDAYYVSLLSGQYRSGRRSYPEAIRQGFRSNCGASRNQRGHSSQIFILSAEKA